MAREGVATLLVIELCPRSLHCWAWWLSYVDGRFPGFLFWKCCMSFSRGPVGSILFSHGYATKFFSWTRSVARWVIRFWCACPPVDGHWMWDSRKWRRLCWGGWQRAVSGACGVGFPRWLPCTEDFLLSLMVRHHISQFVNVREHLHWKSFPNFMSEWTLSRWIRKRFVQTGLSTILTTRRLSIECTIWRDTSHRSAHSLARSIWDGCTIVQEVSFSTRGYCLEKIGPDHGTDHSWNTQVTLRTQLPWIQNSLNEKIEKPAVQTHLEIQQREDIRRDLAERMKFVPPDLRVGERVFTCKKTRVKFSKGEHLEDGWRWRLLLSKVP